MWLIGHQNKNKLLYSLILSHKIGELGKQIVVQQIYDKFSIGHNGPNSKMDQAKGLYFVHCTSYKVMKSGINLQVYKSSTLSFPRAANSPILTGAVHNFLYSVDSRLQRRFS